MQKTKFKVDIHSPGSSNDDILKMVAAHNGGKTPLSIPDFISYQSIMLAIYPSTKKGLTIGRDNDDNGVFHVSEDNGKTFTLTIEEIEVHEIEENQGEEVLRKYHREKELNEQDDLQNVL